jgi:signal transduction histidine kinase
MHLARFRTVRGRLLALLILIALPVACLTAITAFATYRSVMTTIEATQLRVADEYAVRTRIWYRGALRALLAGGEVLGRRPDDATCDAAGMGLLTLVKGFRAIQVVGAGGASCWSSLDAAVNRAELTQALQSMRVERPTRVWAGTELAEVRYGHLKVGGKLYLSIFAESGTTDFRQGLLLVDPDLLDSTFELGEAEPGLVVALESRTGGTIVSRGEEGLGDSWLPYTKVEPQQRERWIGQSRSGQSRAYVARVVAEPDLYVVASFDDGPARAARTQFAILLIAPLAMLALLCVVYLRAIDQHCIRWLRGIEAAARARTGPNATHAPIAPEMPRDIRSVAEAFNTMVDEQEVRQRRLQTALDDNRFLVRELHHRVKNSLQVVQSYIGLTKRDYAGEARVVLADAECRVHVLSAAYRFTLADGEMQPVRVDLFLDDVVTMIANLLRQRDQWITSVIETRATLSVDRVIPLGFVIVDVMSRALRSAPGIGLKVSVTDIDETTIEIAIEADGDVPFTPPPKLFAGLVTQIEAVQVGAAEGRQLGTWRVRHRS